ILYFISPFSRICISNLKEVYYRIGCKRKLIIVCSSTIFTCLTLGTTWANLCTCREVKYFIGSNSWRGWKIIQITNSNHMLADSLLVIRRQGRISLEYPYISYKGFSDFYLLFYTTKRSRFSYCICKL